jgi:AdoMet-dependent heme synthase
VSTGESTGTEQHTPRRGHPLHGPHGVPGVGAVRPDGYVYDRAPMIVYWETTLACGLACRHCRATAMPDRSPAELSTAEGLALLDRITGFGHPLPHVVFTGGDPLRRHDLEDLVRGATERGIGASLAPAVTPDMTLDRLRSLQQAGIQTISLSLDGSDAERHDGLRGVPGTFDMTMQAFDWAASLDLPVQVNTLVTDETLPDLPAVYELLTTKAVLRWALFFLISVGRGSALTEITAGDAERLFQWLYRQTAVAPFQIKTTEATHYRRVAIRLMQAEGKSEDEIARSPVGRGFGIRDGNGIMFVSHEGEVFPSGFLPVSVGNVRTDDVVALYRDHEAFRSLRDVGAFAGRCGLCSYADRCGGSRARAFAHTGDMLESDPLCPYHPPGTDAGDRSLSTS